MLAWQLSGSWERDGVAAQCGAAPTAAENRTVPGMRNLSAQLVGEHRELDAVACFVCS